MQKIVPCLWLEGSIEDAVNFYASVFPNAKITGRMPGPDGRAMAMNFELDGVAFMALAGARTGFTEATSFFVKCKDQPEVDRYWAKLTADGGAESMCGWLKDKYGVSWQIIPDALGETLGGPDKAGAGRAMQAMLQMKKIDVAALRKAYAG
jgi:predicted 3-demethylubiquinone-9 3-methyltransferase (glyoxalase superfamily)